MRERAEERVLYYWRQKMKIESSCVCRHVNWRHSLAPVDSFIVTIPWVYSIGRLVDSSQNRYKISSLPIRCSWEFSIVFFFVEILHHIKATTSSIRSLFLGNQLTWKTLKKTKQGRFHSCWFSPLQSCQFCRFKDFSLSKREYWFLRATTFSMNSIGRLKTSDYYSTRCWRGNGELPAGYFFFLAVVLLLL